MHSQATDWFGEELLCVCVSASAHVILYIVNQVKNSLCSSHRLYTFKCDVLRNL